MFPRSPVPGRPGPPQQQTAVPVNYSQMQMSAGSERRNASNDNEPGFGLGFMDYVTHAVLPYSESMELHNDPRFFQGNVIEKRLQAFEGLSVIGSLTTGTALSQTFALSKSLDLKLVVGWVQAVGLLTMSAILFMSLTSTLVFVYQSFFTHRLITAGATGFELAEEFYLDYTTVRWRHFAVQCLGYGLPLLLFSTGCMLYVKMYNEAEDVIQVGSIHLSIFGLITASVFAFGSLVLTYVTRKHTILFEREYAKRVHPDSRSARAGNEPLLDPRTARLVRQPSPRQMQYFSPFGQQSSQPPRF